MSRVSYNLCFETLSNELRLQILEQLRDQPSSVEQLAKSVNAERSRVSHSLQMLLTCNYVQAERKGKERVYSINPTIQKGMTLDEKGHVLNWMQSHVEHVCHNDCAKAKLLEAKAQ